MNFNNSVEIAKNIYWVGSYLKNSSFQSLPYLIENGDESILVDPGSILEFDDVIRKTQEITDISNIKYIILHHQDPDIVTTVPKIEKIIKRDDLQIVIHSRIKILIKHHLITSNYYEIDKNNLELITNNGLKLQFLTTPYCHSPGAFVSYEPKTKVIFSSDIFGVVEESWEFYAKEDYFEKAKNFHSEYMPSKDIFNYALRKIEKLDINLIAPQHGSIIKKEFISKLIDDMKDLECGLYIQTKYNDELLDTISKLKKKKKKLKKKNNLLDTLLNTTMEAIFIFDDKCNFIQANQSALDMFQLSFDEISLYNMFDFVPKDELLKAHKAESKENVSPYEIKMHKKDKTIFNALITGNNVIINNKRHRISKIIDLTEIKQKERQNFQQTKLAQMGR